MSTYRHMTTNLLSGQVTGDWLPIITQNFSRTINTVGSLSGALNLTAGTALEVINNRLALEPEKTMLWVFQDGAPVWNGIVWDQPHSSILDSTLPISCATPESLFQHRLITDDLTFSGDLFDIFRGLASYALGKTPNGQMAGWTMGTNESGVVLEGVTYSATDMQTVYDAWSALISAYNFEYSVRPAVDASGNVYMSLDLGYPTLGLPLATSGLGFDMPGNLLDYAFPRTGSSAANTVYATATDGSATSDGTSWASQLPHGQDIDGALAQGYPLLETSESLTTLATVTQAQVDAFADGQMAQLTGTQLLPTLTIGNDQYPAASSVTLGSWCQVTATSPLHQSPGNNVPGLQVVGRVVGWTLTPPAGTQTETTQYLLGEIDDADGTYTPYSGASGVI